MTETRHTDRPGKARIAQHDEDPARDVPEGSKAPPDEVDPDLRVRYLDFCAARISEVFLALSDERTYALVEEAAREAGIESGSLGFSEKMDLVTESLRSNVPLPSFEDFVLEYRAHPDRFGEILLEPPERES